MKRRLWIFAVASLLGACGGNATGDEPPRNFSWRRVRVLLSDAQSGQLALFDAEDEAVTHRFDVGGPSRLRSSYSGDYGLAVTPTGVRLVGAGVAIVDHTSHVHVYKSEPQLLSNVVGAAAPSNVVSNGAHIVLAFATPAVQTLLMQVSPTPTAPSMAPAADLILPRLEGMLLAEGSNFSVARYSDGESTVVGPLGACGRVVTFAVSASRLLLACDTGFVLSSSEAAWTPAFVADARGAQAQAAFVHPGSDTAVIRWGAVSMLTLSMQPAAAVLANWDLPVGACDVVLDPQSGGNLQVLTSSGDLQVFSLQGVREKRVAKVVPAFDCATAVRPRFAAAPERAYVVDPRSGHLIDVDLRKPSVVARYPVGGQPHDVVVLGIDPRNAGSRGPLPGEI